jgi:hypothetical protein
MPLPAGTASTRALQASRPPAEAPTPTTGKLALSPDSRTIGAGRSALSTLFSKTSAGGGPLVIANFHDKPLSVELRSLVSLP